MVPNPADPEAQYKALLLHREMALKEGFSAPKYNEYFRSANRYFDELLESAAGSYNISSIPGSAAGSHLAGLAEAPMGVQDYFTRGIREGVLTPEVVVDLGKRMGVPILDVTQGYGSWGSYIEPSISYSGIIPITGGKIDPALLPSMRAFTATLSGLEGESAGAFTQLFRAPSLQASDAIQVSVGKGRMLSPAGIQQVYYKLVDAMAAAARANARPGGLNPSPSLHGSRDFHYGRPGSTRLYTRRHPRGQHYFLADL